MATIQPNRDLIPPPTPGPLRYGLFNVASGPLALTTPQAGSGVQFFADHCEPVLAYDANRTTHPDKIPTEGTDLMGADPFWVYAYKNCGLLGRSGPEMIAAVREQLLSGEQTRVEAVLWNADGGTLANAEPTLVGNVGTAIVVPTAPGAGTAIAALEAAFYATYGHVGTIHVNTAAYAAAAYSQLVQGTPAGKLTTPLGSNWAFGAGYGTDGPEGVEPEAGHVWAFMTGQVTRWQSEIIAPDPRQTADRTLNQWHALAERLHLVTWDCPAVYAVQIPVAAPATTTAPAVPA